MGYEVTAEGSGGRRHYAIDGKRVDRLSHLLDAIIAKGPGLEKWRGANVIERARLMPLGDFATLPPYTALNRLPRLPGLSPADIGTIAHKAAELGDFDPDHYHPEASVAVQAVGRFFAEEKPEFEERETPVGSRQYRYAGTPDGRAYLPRLGKFALVDYKWAKNLYERYHYQLGFYELASVEMGKDPTDDRIIVWLQQDGTYKLIPSVVGVGDCLTAVRWFRNLEDTRERIAA